ncbi:MAG: hypothetical protein IKP88_21620 [Lachnospiraceae bacterium]|nr:hypothetical protein [Lachnospiraceae bacterium]
MRQKVNKSFAAVAFTFLMVVLFTHILGNVNAFADEEETPDTEVSSKYYFVKDSKILYVGWKSYFSVVAGTGEKATISYRSDNKKIATVTKEGEIIPVSKGLTMIYADVTEDGVTSSCSMEITVREPYSKVTASTSAMTLDSDFVFELKRYGHNSPVSWELIGKDYASIEAVSATDCKIHTLAPGTVKLVAKCGNEKFSFDIKIYDGKGELFVISPNSKPYNNYYINNSTYNSKTKGYYLLRSYLERLDTLKGGVLVLQKGTYVVTNTLCIPSNTTIVLEDGAIVRKSDDTGTEALPPNASLFQTVSYSNAAIEGVFSKYDGEHDIKILGEGKAYIDVNNLICQGLAICHCQRVTVSGITFINMNTYHFIELDASKNVYIKNNYFFGCTASSSLKKEAINIDTPDLATHGFTQNWTSFDKTPVLDVYITDNLFYDVECGIGTHKYSDSSPHKNVNILRNTFINCHTYFIRAMNWETPVIKDNNFVLTEVPNKEKIMIILNGAINPLITDNRFENAYTPVSFYHWRNTGYGSEYPPVYNKLDSSYAAALKNNYLVNVLNAYYEYYDILDDFHEDSLHIYPIDGYSQS